MTAIWFYRLLMAPLLTVGFVVLSPFHKKIRAAFKAKRRPLPKTQFQTRPLWIHAASGEFEYAKPVIREFKALNPDVPVVVTYSSTTYVSQIEKFQGVDLALPLPIDLPGPTSALIKRLNPRAFLLARTDFWPELLFQLRKKRIPSHVFSYTQKDPKRLSFVGRRLRRWVLKMTDRISCVTSDDVLNVQALGVDHAQVIGDTRYDQVAFRLAHGKSLPEALRPNLKTFVAGSTWPEDEKALIPALKPLLTSGRAQLILTPHEPTPSHLEAIQDLLKRHQLTFKLYSQKESWHDTHVLIVDQTGVLAELYQWGTFAFIGGSFRGSVHSVMEALGAGLPTLVGPHYQNNREAIEFSKLELSGKKPVRVCSDVEELGKAADALVRGEHPKKNEILEVFKAREGASKKIVAAIGEPSTYRPSYPGTNALHS